MYARGGYDVSFTVCSWPLFSPGLLRLEPHAIPWGGAVPADGDHSEEVDEGRAVAAKIQDLDLGLLAALNRAAHPADGGPVDARGGAGCV